MTLTWVALLALAVAEAVLLVPIARALRARGASLTVALSVAAALVGVGAAMFAVFRALNLDVERHAAFLWVVVAAVTVLVGAIAAVREKRLPTIELLIASVLVLEAAAALLFVRVPDAHFASPEVRALVVGIIVVLLAIYFGASVGFLIWGAGTRADSRLGYEAFVGRRFLLSKASPVLSTVTTISVLGVTLGVALVIFALAILHGFESDLETKIIGANAHVVVQKPGGRTFALESGMVERLDEARGVEAAAPYLEGEVALASRANYTVGLIFGIDPARSPEVLSVLGTLVEGSLAALTDAPIDAPQRAASPSDFAPPARVPGIVIGSEMKKNLNVELGDRVRVISPLLEQMSPVGMVPASQAFEVVAVFSSKMYEFDSRYAYVTLPAARRFLRAGPDDVSGVQLRADDPDHADLVGRDAVAHLGDASFTALDWKARNITLFSALKLERIVAFVVLVFIILVASFSIVNTLTMSIIEKKKEIAILKTMGARDVGITKIFLVQGMLVGVLGTLLGAAAALLLVGALKSFGFWIPGDVYYIDSLPVHLTPADVVLVVVAALVIVWDFAVFPALRGSRFEPVEGLRDG